METKGERWPLKRASRNNTINIDSPMSDDARRHAVYQGQIFVYLRSPAVTRFVEFTRGLIEEAFALLDPCLAQHRLLIERFAAILGELKPRFIHHPESKRHLQDILLELGCDPVQTYFDVPKLRSSTSDGYLTTGIAYAWHPQRYLVLAAPLPAELVASCLRHRVRKRDGL